MPTTNQLSLLSFIDCNHTNPQCTIVWKDRFDVAPDLAVKLFFVASGVLRAAQDVKIAQLQTTALDTIAVVLKATVGGSVLPSEQQAAVRERLSIMIAEHKSSAVKAQAIDVKALLSDGNNADAQMDDAGAL